MNGTAESLLVEMEMGRANDMTRVGGYGKWK